MKLRTHHRNGIINNLPDYMVEGLIRYIEDGILPGSFLHAILRNDLQDACACADNTNRCLIWEYVNVLWNYSPSDCWGSPEKVQRWVEAREHERKGGTSEAHTEALL